MEKMHTDLFTTVSEANKWILENREDGCICPCCSQITKIYRRKLNKGMACELIALYKLCNAGIQGQYFHHGKFATVSCGEISKLEYWGLVEQQMKDEDKTKKTSGYWRITEKGKLFVENKINVQSHVFIFDAKLIGFSDDNISVYESLGNKFNYDELMKS